MIELSLSVQLYVFSHKTTGSDRFIIRNKTDLPIQLHHSLSIWQTNLQRSDPWFSTI